MKLVEHSGMILSGYVIEIPTFRVHNLVKSFRESGEISAHNWDKLLN